MDRILARLLFGLPVNRVEAYRFRSPARNMLCNLPGVEAAVLDEPASGPIATAYCAREIYPRPGRLEADLIVNRRSIPIVRKRDPQAFEERKIRVIAGHR